jgi:hypothetical protein
LKNPSRFDEDEEAVSKANKKAEGLYKSAEKDLDKFKELLDAEVSRLSSKDPVSSVLLAIVGYKAIDRAEAGEVLSVDFGDLDDEDAEYEDELSPGEEEEIEQEVEKKSASDTWTQIAREEGFKSVAGAKQVIDAAGMEYIVSLAKRAFRKHVQQLSSKNKLSAAEARDLMASAKIGPGATDNDLFRYFFGELFYQPYINSVIKGWRQSTEDFFREQGIDDDILAKNAVSLVRMATGETTPNLEKIVKLGVPKDSFRKVRSMSQNWIEDSTQQTSFAKNFASNVMVKSNKVAKAFDKAQRATEDLS